MSNQKKTGGAFSSKQFKYGSVAAVLTVVFIAVVILLNAVFSALSSQYGFVLDLTHQQIYGISDQTRELLADQTKEVTIKFMLPLDQLESASEYYPVVTCAQQYAREFPNVKVEYYDIITRPDHLQYFTGKGYTVSTTDVIVQCGDEFKIFSLGSFLPKAESTGNIYAFRGEMYFTSAILAVTAENQPEVTFTTNHGESVSPYLEDIFELCGYKVNQIDLATQQISDATKILVIYDPKFDFQSFEGGNSEIEKLAGYLGSNRSAMVFLSPSTQTLPNLDELLLEWGISVTRNQVVLDEGHSLPNYNTHLICDYPALESTSQEETPAGVIVGGSVSSGQTVSGISAPLVLSTPLANYVTVESVLRSSLDAYVEADGKKISGPFDVMAVATRSQIVNHGNSINQEVKGHLLVSSSTNFATLCYDSSPYANQALIFNAIKLMSDEDTITNISMKRVDDTSLSIKAEDVTRYTVIMATVLPGLIVIGGIAVWIKRKHL